MQLIIIIANLSLTVRELDELEREDFTRLKMQKRKKG
jgi:vacuolar-type H+-ATPase subunit D/Vma8